MSIQGTLEKYELSEVLLSLSMNQQTGTLTFTRPEGEPIQIYYLKGAIFVIHSEIQSIEELERLLVDARRATSKQMKSALKNKEQTQRFIGDVLVDMNILKEYELINLLQNYIEDTLFSIFIEEEAEFQFELNMAPPNFTYPLPEPISRANSHVIECLNKLSLWEEIRQYFPTLKEIFVFTQELSSIEMDISDEEKRELGQIDGQKQVGEIFRSTLLSNIRMGTIMAELINAGLLRLLKVEEALEFGNSLKEKGKYEEAIQFYDYATTQDEELADLHFNYGEALEALGRDDEAVREYRSAANYLFDEGKYDQVLQAYMNILSIDTSNINVLEKLFDAYLRSARKEETLEIGQKLGKLLTDQKEYENAVLIYSHLVKLFPREIPFRKELAKCYHQVGEIDLATQQLNIVRRIEMEAKRQAKQKLNRILRKLAFTLLFLVIIGGGAVLGMMLYNYQQLKEAKRKAKTLEDFKQVKFMDVSEFKSEKQITEVYSNIKEAWQKVAKLGDEALALKNIERLNKEETNQKEIFQRRKKGKRKLIQVEKAEKEALAKGDFKKLFFLRRSKITEHNLAIVYENSTVQLPLILQVSPSEAEVYFNGKIVKNHPNHPNLYFYKYGEEVNLLEIKVSKPGYKSKTLAIKNPRNYQGRVTILLERKFNWKVDIEGGVFASPLQQGNRFFLLTREGYFYCFPLENETSSSKYDYSWRRKIGLTGDRFSPMTLLDNHIAFGNSQGQVFLFTRSNEKYQINISSYPITSPPTPFQKGAQDLKGMFMVGGVDGNLHIAKKNPSSASYQGKLKVGGGPIHGKVLHIYKRGTHYILVAAADNILRYMKLSTIKGETILSSVWNIASDGEFEASPILYRGMALVGNREGTFYAVDISTGTTLWTLKTKGPISAPARVVGDNLIAIGNEAGEFYLLSISEQRDKYKVTWKEKLLPIYNAPAYSRSDSTIYIPSALSYRQHIVTTTNDEVIKGRVLVNNEEEVQIENYKFAKITIPTKKVKSIEVGHFVEKGLLYSLDLQGKKHLWRVPVKGGLYGTPLIHNQEIIFATSEGTVYSLNR